MENIQDKQDDIMKFFSKIKKDIYKNYIYNGNKYRFIGYIKGQYTSNRMVL